MQPSIAPRSVAPSSRLAQVQRGRQRCAKRVLLYGDGGLGKTTLAAGASRPLFIDVNQGSLGFDVDRYVFDDAGRTKPATFAELLGAVRDVTANGVGKYDTLVLDALSDIEDQLVFPEVVRRDGKATNIEEVGGGFMKGYTAAVDEWRRITSELELVWSAGIDVVLIDHSEVKKEKNVEGADYGRLLPKIHTAASKFLHRWCDYTLLIAVDTVLVPDSKEAKKVKKLYAQSTGARVLHARPAAEWMTKSRPELPDPLMLPATGGWQFLEDEIAGARARRVDELRAGIETAIAALGPEDGNKARAALERAADDDSKLEQLSNWCATRAAKKENA